MLYNSTVSQIAVQNNTVYSSTLHYFNSFVFILSNMVDNIILLYCSWGLQKWLHAFSITVQNFVKICNWADRRCSQCRHARGLRWLWTCFSRAILYGTVYNTTVQYMCIFCLQQKTLHLEYEYNTLQYSTLRCLAIKMVIFHSLTIQSIDLVITNQQRYFEPRILFFEARCLVKITERFTPESTNHLMPCGFLPAGRMSWNHHLKMA